MRSKRNRVISIIVMIVVMILIGTFLFRNRELLLSIKKIPWELFGAVIATRILVLGINGLILKLLAEKFFVRLRFVEWYGLATVTAMTNYIAPFSAGLVVRAGYLKKRHNFPYAQFASMVAATYLMLLLVTGLSGSVASLCILKTSTSALFVLAIFIMITVAISAIMLVPEIQIKESGRISKILNNGLSGWSLIRKDFSLISKLFVLVFIVILINGLAFWVIYKSLGSTITPWEALIISLLPYLSMAIRITPANLGIQEALIAFTSGVLGMGSELGLLVALVIRAARLIPVFLLGPIFSYLLSRQFEPTHAGDISSAIDGDEPGIE